MNSSSQIYAKITGPIVMVGFGSIGKGTLPMIERHLDYDKSLITVIDPKDEGRKAHCEKHNVKFIQKAVTGIGLFIAGLLVSLAGFPDPATHKPAPPSAVVNLALMYLPTIIGLYGVAALILFGYRITRERHEENLRTLAQAAALEPPPPG